MKILQKILALSIILSLIAPAAYGPFLARTAEAQFTDPSQVAQTAITARMLAMDIINGVAMTIAQKMIDDIVRSTIDWAQTGFDGNPAYATNPGQYFTDIADGVAGDFIGGSELGFLCSPFQTQVRIALQRQYSRGPQFQCTLSQVAGNIEGFYQDFNQGGWDAWYTMTQNPANNPYGAFLEAQLELDKRIASAVGLEEKQLNWSQGFLSWRGECQMRNPEQYTPDGVVDPDHMPGLAVGECLDGKYGWPASPVSTPGSTIKSQLDKVLPSGLDKLISAQSWDQLISAFASGLLNRYVFGSQGLFASAGTTQSDLNSRMAEVDLDGDSVPDGRDIDYDGSLTSKVDRCYHGGSVPNCATSSANPQSPYYTPVCQAVNQSIITISDFFDFINRNSGMIPDGENFTNKSDSQLWGMRANEALSSTDEIINAVTSYRSNYLEPLEIGANRHGEYMDRVARSLLADGQDLDLKYGWGTGDGGGLGDLIQYTSDHLNFLSQAQQAFGNCASPNVSGIQNLTPPVPPSSAYGNEDRSGGSGSGGTGGGGFCDASQARYEGVLLQAMNNVIAANPNNIANANPQVNQPVNGREFRVNAYEFLTYVAQELQNMGYNATADVLNGNSNTSTGDIIAVWSPGDSTMERYDAISGAATTMSGAIMADYTGTIPLTCTASGGGTNCSCATSGGGGTGGTGGAMCSAGNFGNSPGAPSTINFSEIIWDENPGVANWSQTSNLSNVNVCGTNCINMPYDAANSWPQVYYSMFNGEPVVGNAWVVVWRNGAWHGATFEWLRPGQTQKGLENLLGADGTLRGPLGNFSPKNGEMYGFMITTPARDGRQESNQRTNLVTMVWNGTTCSTSGSTGGGSAGGTGGGALPPGGTGGATIPLAPRITSVNPASVSGGTTITINGTDLRNTTNGAVNVQFFDYYGARSTVAGTSNSAGTQVTAVVPTGLAGPSGYVRMDNGSGLISNSVAIQIGTPLQATSPINVWRPTLTTNGWWPRLSPDGRYVAYGNWGESWVTDLQTGESRDLRNPADLAGIEHRCIAGQWITPTKLTFTCESSNIGGDNQYRYEVTVGEWTPRRTTENTGLVAGSQFVARDGHWASYLANASARLAKDNQLVATGVGGAMDISGDQIIHACTTSYTSLCLRTGTTLTRTFSTQVPISQSAITNGYIIYGGYGPIRGITPSGTDTNLRISNSYSEGAGKSMGIMNGSSAQVIVVNGTYWVASAAWGAGGNYIFLRPWGSKTAIVVQADASSIDVAVSGNNFIIAYNDARGIMAVLTVPINSPRISIP